MTFNLHPSNHNKPTKPNDTSKNRSLTVIVSIFFIAIALMFLFFQDTIWRIFQSGSEQSTRKQKITSGETLDADSKWQERKIHANEGNRLMMAWDMSYTKGNDALGTKKIDGLDIISPTWFQIQGDKGRFIDRSYSSYVQWAHQNGYKVWALLANDFDNPTTTVNFLKNKLGREKLSRAILDRVRQLKIDGINLDFEMIPRRNADLVLDFLKELQPQFKTNHLTLSLDIAVPESMTSTYSFDNLNEISKIVDYICLMGYDQRYAKSTNPGSIAELSWVENNLNKLLDAGVPETKIILAIPFYSRLWELKSGAGRQDFGTGKTVLTMHAMEKIVSENNPRIDWDHVSGQLTAEYEKDNLRYKVWLEDENSIKKRAELVNAYGLAGVSAWCLGFETENIWPTMKGTLKKNKEGK